MLVGCLEDYKKIFISFPPVLSKMPFISRRLVTKIYGFIAVKTQEQRTLSLGFKGKCLELRSFQTLREIGLAWAAIEGQLQKFQISKKWDSFQSSKKLFCTSSCLIETNSGWIASEATPNYFSGVWKKRTEHSSWRNVHTGKASFLHKK